jgi:hypothetical protein
MNLLGLYGFVGFIWIYLIFMEPKSCLYKLLKLPKKDFGIFRIFWYLFGPFWVYLILYIYFYIFLNF